MTRLLVVILLVAVIAATTAIPARKRTEKDVLQAVIMQANPKLHDQELSQQDLYWPIDVWPLRFNVHE